MSILYESDYPLRKDQPIVNKELLKKCRNVPCELCGGEWEVAGHHILKKSRLRLDIPENLVSLCIKCHFELHNYPKTFKEKHGADKFRELMDWRPIIELYREKYCFD